MSKNEDLNIEIGENHIGTSAHTPLRADAFVISDEEKIELIKPEKRDELFQDLKDRTGLDIQNIDIVKIDEVDLTDVEGNSYFAALQFYKYSSDFYLLVALNSVAPCYVYTFIFDGKKLEEFRKHRTKTDVDGIRNLVYLTELVHLARL